MKILSFSDIDWSQYRQLTNVVAAEDPDLVVLAGDIAGDGFSRLSRSPNRLEWFLNFLENRGIKTYTVKGNWDNENYDDLIQGGRYKFIEDISEKYATYKGVTLLGIPYAFFESLRNVRGIRQKFPKPADVVIAHPPTKRRIWIFELQPRLVLLGHDDLRVCKILNTLLISTNCSPSNFSILTLREKDISISYRQYCHPNVEGGYSPWSFGDRMKQARSGELYQGYLTYDAIWQIRSKVLIWKTEEHYCYQPPYAYPAKDAEYGEMLGKLISAKKRFRKAELSAELAKLSLAKVTKTLISEYLGV